MTMCGLIQPENLKSFPWEMQNVLIRGNPLFDTGYGTCIAPDGNGALRSNFWGPTDVRSELQRTNVVMFINHDLGNGLESFTELGVYSSDSDRTAHASYAFTSSKHRVGPDNYYLNQSECEWRLAFVRRQATLY